MTKRNNAYLKLQMEQKKEQTKQDKAIELMQASYEQRIIELTKNTIPHSVSIASNHESKLTEKYDVFISHAW